MTNWQFWLLMAVLFGIASDIAAMPKPLSRLGRVHVVTSSVAMLACAVKALLS